MNKIILSKVEDIVSDYWGGVWTHDKMDIFNKYLKAYLQIMKGKGFELIYFDGFAGSGIIKPKSDFGNILEGVALQVLSINEPITFDIYYLVERNKNKTQKLKETIKSRYPDKEDRVFVVNVDCNEKLVSLSKYLKSNKKRKAIGFIDPHGMAVNWYSLEKFKGLYCDMWILVPTGIGVNRMLTKDGNIKESWLIKLSSFLGINEDEIMDNFYSKTKATTLFGDEEIYTLKDQRAIDKIIKLYSERLSTVWRYVSQPFPMTNSKGSLMFHFLLASQVPEAVKIANEVVGKKLR